MAFVKAVEQDQDYMHGVSSSSVKIPCRVTISSLIGRINASGLWKVRANIRRKHGCHGRGECHVGQLQIGCAELECFV